MSNHKPPKRHKPLLPAHNPSLKHPVPYVRPEPKEGEQLHPADIYALACKAAGKVIPI